MPFINHLKVSEVMVEDFRSKQKVLFNLNIKLISFNKPKETCSEQSCSDIAHFSLSPSRAVSSTIMTDPEMTLNILFDSIKTYLPTIRIEPFFVW